MRFEWRRKAAAAVIVGLVALFATPSHSHTRQSPPHSVAASKDWAPAANRADARKASGPFARPAPASDPLAFAQDPLPAASGGKGWRAVSFLRTRLAAGSAASPAPVPPRRHVVAKGDTLWRVAQANKVDVAALQALNARPGDRLRPGQVLRIPVAGPAPDLTARRRVAYAWPARGVLTSRFGARWRRHHSGIDVAAPRGMPIFAARDGIVREAGWSGGYGKLVVLEHVNGQRTYYGHASALYVKLGQSVKSGQRIAAVGCTGACTGAHLHFEIRTDGQPVDPLPYLR